MAGAVALALAWAPTAAHALSFEPAPGSPFPVSVGAPAPVSVAVGEFNGDANPDLAVANNNTDNVSVLLGGAGGSFAAAAGSPFPVGDAPSSVAVGDFDGDSNRDLAVANANPSNVSVLLGDGSGGFAPATGSPFPTGGVTPVSVAVGEFNGDSDPDLAVTNFGSDNVSVLLGGLGGSFAAATGSPFSAGDGPRSVAVGEFNGDADPDLAVANQFSDNVSVLLGGAGGSFAAAAGSPFPGVDNPQDVAVANFNGDSRPDLAVANGLFFGGVSVLLGGPGGSFAAAPGSPFSAGGAPSSVAVAEFNGDQDPDLAVANSQTGNVSVLLGGPGGSFVTATGSPFPVGTTPRDVAVGEFNGNADPDLAVANQFSDDVSVLLGANGYVRPAAASPLRVSLVPAYRVCRAPNRSHGPPLASPSCAPPTQLSQYATVGTFDANGEPAASTGFVRLHVVPGNPATPADEANVGLAVSVTDVRNAQGLSDYTGELQVSMTFQLTDGDIAAAPGEPGTLQQLAGIRFTVPCAATGGAVGSTCAVNTTADAVTPGMVKERERAIWELGQVIVLDGGEDGLASTPDDNTIFLKQGVFVP